MHSLGVYWVYLVVLVLSGTYAWDCDVTLIGNTSQPQQLEFSTASIRCAPGERESDLILTAGISPPLAAATFEGKKSTFNMLSATDVVVFLTTFPRACSWVDFTLKANRTECLLSCNVCLVHCYSSEYYLYVLCRSDTTAVARPRNFQCIAVHPSQHYIPQHTATQHRRLELQ